MTRLSTHLLGLLATSTSKAVGLTVPRIAQHLYGGPLELVSLLDGLMENDWKQRPAVEAMADVPAGEKSVVLRATTPDSLLTRADFHFMYPVKRDRVYKVDGPLQFTVVKRRGANMVFGGAYYLVFRNYRDACVYWMETRGKRLNGGGMAMEFVGMDEVVGGLLSTLNEVKSANEANIVQNSTLNTLNEVKSASEKSFVQSATEASVVQNTQNSNSTLISTLNASDVPSTAPGDQVGSLNTPTTKDGLAASIINYRSQNPSYSPESYTTTDPHYNLLNQLINNRLRQRLVLVKNLPVNLSHFSLMKLLWNYDFPSDKDHRQWFTSIAQDARRQTTLTLIEFADSKNANRFVRNFHGKPWDSMYNSTKKEIKLYGPVLCEVIGM